MAREHPITPHSASGLDHNLLYQYQRKKLAGCSFSTAQNSFFQVCKSRKHHYTLPCCNMFFLIDLQHPISSSKAHLMKPIYTWQTGCVTQVVRSYCVIISADPGIQATSSLGRTNNKINEPIFFKDTTTFEIDMRYTSVGTLQPPGGTSNQASYLGPSS